MRYTHVRTIAGRGAAAEHFRSLLAAITCDGEDTLYACGDAEVKVFGADGRLRRAWASSGPACSIAVAPDGRVLVGLAGAIEIFEPGGRPVAAWRDPDRLGRVTAIGVADGDVLAADSAARCIRRFDRTGRFLNDIGRDNRTEGFLIPNGALDFAIDAAGTVHAANPGKHRVERYARDGRLLGHFGRFGGLDPAGFSGCCNPTNVALDRDGNVYVTEKAEPRAKRYAPDGTLRAIVASGVFDPNCKNMDLTVDSRGAVYVADTVRLAVHVFAPETGDE
jgi:sugar lactone lactonase YvrE